MARSFFSSNHKGAYIRIAFANFTTPGHVFDLAHGKVEPKEKDQKIMQALKDAKIIRHRHSHS